MRLDKYLVAAFSLRSRTYAENLIKRGAVKVGDCVEKRPAFDVDECDPPEIEILSDEDFASLGAYKLQKAFDDFSLDVCGADCADIGCSNGGFTDLLLRKGARSVLAVDVGECALDKRILDSGKVEFLRANARDLPPIPEKDFVCADVSFISVTLILDSVRRILRENGKAVLLVKPQFELGRAVLDKRGIVKNERLSRSALDLVSAAAVRSGFAVTGSTEIPRLFEDKNVEYLLLLTPVKNTSSIA